MSCVKMLLLNCSDSATDSQVAQTSGLLGQEDVQLAALLMSAIPRYAVSHKVKFRFSTLVMPVTGSTAAGWSEIKRQRSDKITCALFAMWTSCICQWLRDPRSLSENEACVYKASYFSAHFLCILQKGFFKQLYPLQNLGYVLVTGKSWISSTATVEKLSCTEYSKSSICGALSVFWLLLLQVDLIIQFSFKQIGLKHSLFLMLPFCCP